ncbi:MAG: ABC transporter permease [Actinobacteria bacterium]|nr:ABC transporter permease [Actinomycetota bacterium]
MKKIKLKDNFIFLVVILLTIVIYIVNPVFFTLGNLLDILRAISVPGIFAIGAFLVIISGGVDLSFGAIATAASILCGKYMESGGQSVIVTFLIGAAIGISFGALNAVLVGKLKIPTIIATLGTFSIYRSAIILFVPNSTGYGLSENFINFSKINFYGIPVQTFFYIAVCIITWAILKYTLIGRGIYAIGGSIESSSRIGLNTFRVQLFIYCYAGFLAALAGVLHISITQIYSARSFIGVEFAVITAVILGGASIVGGKGTVLATVFGSLFVIVVNNGLILMKVNPYWYNIFLGILILASVMVDANQKRIIEQRVIKVNVE